MYKLLESGVEGKTHDIISHHKGYSLSPTIFNIYINELAKSLEQSVASSITLVDTEIKYLLFAGDLVLLSPTKE